MARRRISKREKQSLRRYNSYVYFLKKRVKNMKEKGLSPYVDPVSGISGEKKLTYREYKEIYIEEKNERLKKIEKGGKASLDFHNINRKIISDQVYELSEKQAYAIFDYMKTLPEEERKGFKIFEYRRIDKAIMKIREGSFVREELGLWDKIRARRAELFNQGYNKAEVAEVISSEFFYPEEEEE